MSGWALVIIIQTSSDVMLNYCDHNLYVIVCQGVLWWLQSVRRPVLEWANVITSVRRTVSEWAIMITFRTSLGVSMSYYDHNPYVVQCQNEWLWSHLYVARCHDKLLWSQSVWRVIVITSRPMSGCALVITFHTSFGVMLSYCDHNPYVVRC